MWYNMGYPQQHDPALIGSTGIVRQSEVNTMSTPNDTVFIYVLQRISDKAYLYIGSAKNPKARFGRHRLKNPYRIIREAFEHDDIRFIVITSTDAEHRFDVEHALWSQFKAAGHPIVNIDPAFTRYDYGQTPWNKGITHSPEARAKMSAQRKGKPLSAETKAKMSAVRKGRVSPMKGRTFSAESRRKISEAGKGRRASDETRKKMSEYQKHRPEEHSQKINEHHRNRSAETRRRISESAKRRPPISEETRRKMSEAHKGAYPSEETRKKLSEAHKGHHPTEETREKLRAAQRKRKEDKKEQNNGG